VRADGAIATTAYRADQAPNHAGAPARSKPMLSILLQGLALLGNTDRYDTEELAANALVGTIRTQKATAERTDAAQIAELGAAVKARDESKAAIATLTAERDAAKTRADAAEAELTKLRAEAKTRADAEARTHLEPLCKKHRLDAAAHPDLPKLKHALAVAEHGGELPAELNTDAHVDAIVQMALKDHTDGLEAGERLWTGLGGEGGGAGHRADAHGGQGGASTRPVSTMRSRWGGKPVGGAA
jgi:hypothetical protein